jgi:PBP1b-binding outer membrane lipoprotein LpoB
MRLTKILSLLSGLAIILTGCNSLSEAGKVLRNEKTRTTDEFLIEKKGPLSQPPDFQKIPKPGSTENRGEATREIEEILKTTRQSETRSGKTSSSSTEDSILRQIKK